MLESGESILDSVKKVIGFDKDYEAFDIDIIMHINSVFSTLHQLGVGPVGGFSITDHNSKWDEFIGDIAIISSVKSYVCLKVRLMFDPPSTSFGITAFEKQTEEFEWRLMTAMDPYIVTSVLGIEEIPVW